MNVETLTELFGWMSVISIGILMFSTFMLLAIRKFAVNVHSKMFHIDEKDLNRAYFQYLAQFKIVVIVFHLTPYLALKIIG